MKQHNLYLVPELIINLVDKFKAATNENEKYYLSLRLESVKDYITDALIENKGKFQFSMYKPRK
jgi:hypothetical protein